MIVVESNAPTAPGLYRMPEEVYHADPCPAPSASSGALRTLLERSPFHAWARHPRLNPAPAQEAEAARLDLGAVAHTLVLGEGSEIEVLPFADYRKEAAQEARDAARKAGKTPVLAEAYERAQALAEPMREAVQEYTGYPIADCLREVVLVWQEGGHWRRIRLDLATPDLMTLVDLKTTAASVAPSDCVRRIYDDGYHIQAGFYTRGVDAIHKAGRGRRRFAFVFAEVGAPHAISPPIVLSAAGLQMAGEQVETALALWDSCLRANHWPSYGADEYSAEPPTWTLNRWSDRRLSDSTLNPIPEAA